LQKPANLPGAKALAGSFAMSRFAGDSAPGKRQVAKAFSILPGLLPLAKCNISCSERLSVYAILIRMSRR